MGWDREAQKEDKLRLEELKEEQESARANKPLFLTNKIAKKR